MDAYVSFLTLFDWI